MLNAVIDTNVFVSGLITAHGFSAKIINSIKEKHFNMFYCSEIMSEYRDVLYRDKFGFNPKDVDNLLEIISLYGLSVTIDASEISLPDEDDRCFYDIAKKSGAYLVTGNIKHYPGDSWVITPAEFANLLDAYIARLPTEK
ncbi:MAG: putative toxin-antitoxin system toxin component, PIN family [Oscillospiraceae bacterium]|nr:putative toxin-antitoxin system toxin component, PIN family [Oscillospiraceae bacterium]